MSDDVFDPFGGQLPSSSDSNRAGAQQPENTNRPTETDTPIPMPDFSVEPFGNMPLPDALPATNAFPVSGNTDPFAPAFGDERFYHLYDQARAFFHTFDFDKALECCAACLQINGLTAEQRTQVETLVRKIETTREGSGPGESSDPFRGAAMVEPAFGTPPGNHVDFNAASGFGENPHFGESDGFETPAEFAEASGFGETPGFGEPTGFGPPAGFADDYSAYSDTSFGDSFGESFDDTTDPFQREMSSGIPGDASNLVELPAINTDGFGDEWLQTADATNLLMVPKRETGDAGELADSAAAESEATPPSSDGPSDFGFGDSGSAAGRVADESDLFGQSSPPPDFAALTESPFDSPTTADSPTPDWLDTVTEMEPPPAVLSAAAEATPADNPTTDDEQWDDLDSLEMTKSTELGRPMPSDETRAWALQEFGVNPDIPSIAAAQPPPVEFLETGDTLEVSFNTRDTVSILPESAMVGEVEAIAATTPPAAASDSMMEHENTPPTSPTEPSDDADSFEFAPLSVPANSSSTEPPTETAAPTPAAPAAPAEPAAAAAAAVESAPSVATAVASGSASESAEAAVAVTSPVVEPAVAAVPDAVAASDSADMGVESAELVTAATTVPTGAVTPNVPTPVSVPIQAHHPATDATAAAAAAKPAATAAAAAKAGSRMFFSPPPEDIPAAAAVAPVAAAAPAVAPPTAPPAPVAAAAPVAPTPAPVAADVADDAATIAANRLDLMHATESRPAVRMQTGRVGESSSAPASMSPLTAAAAVVVIVAGVVFIMSMLNAPPTPTPGDNTVGRGDPANPSTISDLSNRPRTNTGTRPVTNRPRTNRPADPLIPDNGNGGTGDPTTQPPGTTPDPVPEIPRDRFAVALDGAVASALPPGQVSTDYKSADGRTVRVVSNYYGGLTFRVTPALPAGLALDSRTGDISGRPQASVDGIFTFHGYDRTGRAVVEHVLALRIIGVEPSVGVGAGRLRPASLPVGSESLVYIDLEIEVADVASEIDTVTVDVADPQSLTALKGVVWATLNGRLLPPGRAYTAFSTAPRVGVTLTEPLPPGTYQLTLGTAVEAGRTPGQVGLRASVGKGASAAMQPISPAEPMAMTLDVREFGAVLEASAFVPTRDVAGGERGAAVPVRIIVDIDETCGGVAEIQIATQGGLLNPRVWGVKFNNAPIEFSRADETRSGVTVKLARPITTWGTIDLTMTGDVPTTGDPRIEFVKLLGPNQRGEVMALPAKDERSLRLDIRERPAIMVNMPEWVVGRKNVVVFEGRNFMPIEWELSGKLPTGLVFAAGVITGTPTDAPGHYEVAVTARAAGGEAVTKTIHLIVRAAR